MKITAQNQNNFSFFSGFLKSLINIRYIILSGSRGFTLVEVLVAATILATLVGGVLLTLNPLEQLNKSQDSQRMSDLQAVKTALDLYYIDNGCYPTEVPFGNEWRISNIVYMKEVPQDPRCTEENGTCYRYRTDSGNTCPQWNVVFAELSRNSTLADACPLSSLSNCTPEGYADGSFACTMSGAVDCNELLASSLLGGIETVGPTNTPTPGPTATPTPTPTPDPNAVTFPLPQNANPDPYEVTINPLYPIPGAVQSISLRIDDPGVSISSVEVVVTSDGGAQRSFYLNPPTGSTNNAGTWTGTRQVGGAETFYDLYAMEFFITAGSGAGQIVGTESITLAATGR